VKALISRIKNINASGQPSPKTDAFECASMQQSCASMRQGSIISFILLPAGIIKHCSIPFTLMKINLARQPPFLAKGGLCPYCNFKRNFGYNVENGRRVDKASARK
jgi:hypothetical protein